QAGYTGDGGRATQASFNAIVSLAYDDARHSVFLDDLGNGAVRRVDVRSGIVTTLALLPDACPEFGGGCLRTPLFLTIGSDYLVVTEHTFQRVIRFDLRAPAPVGEVIAGFPIFDGPNGVVPDEIPATSSRLSAPEGVAIDGAGKLYFVEYGGSQRARRLGL